MKTNILSNTRLSKISLSTFGPFIAFILVYGFFAILNAKILSLTAVETIIQQTVIVGIGAIGMTFVIISGGIDLSVGSIIAMGSVAVAFLMQTFGLDPLLAAVGGVLVGLLWGFINGVLIARFKMVPFIVTLGTLLVVRGVAKGIAHSMPINTGHTWLSDLLAALPQSQKWQLIPPGAWLMILLALLMAAVLKYLPIGRHVYAIGSSEQTARLCGIAVERVKIFVYTLCGGLAGLGGLMLMS